MLQEINGNLLDFPNDINIIVHQANCQNTFGAGIAAQIKKRYPEAYNADTRFHGEFQKAKKSMLGHISVAELNPRAFIINLYAQHLGSGQKRATNYEAFAQGLEELANFASQYPALVEPIIGFPKFIGCGLGGGSWRIIEAMLDDFQKTIDYQVIIIYYDVVAAQQIRKKVA